jgi:predicted dehydrogenase
MLRVSIVGARRNRNGIGEYIAKYFHQEGANVVAALGTSEESSQAGVLALRKYGIEATPYARFEKMVAGEKPDVVVIASPADTHYAYLVRSIESGLHVFCEKPLFWPVQGDPEEAVCEILRRAEEKKVTVSMNCQLPFIMADYEKLCGKVEGRAPNRFFIRLSPAFPGSEMIPDSVPHVLSLLFFQFGEGRVVDLSFELREPEDMDIRFKYLAKSRGCEVHVKLVRREEQPREFHFGFNDRIVRRTIDLGDYGIYFEHGEKRVRIEDPLKKAVKSFIEAVEQGKEPFLGYAHILNNMKLLKAIYEGYEGN